MIKVFATALLSAALATGASAATFKGYTYGYFTNSNIDGAANNNCLFNFDGFYGDSGVAWGDASGTPPGDCPDTTGDNQDSRLGFHWYEFDEEITGHEDVLIGKIDWVNWVNFGAVDFAAQGIMRLALTDPFVDFFPEDPLRAHASETMLFNIENTQNPEADHIMAAFFDNYGIGFPLVLGNGLRLDGFKFALHDPITGEELAFGEEDGRLKLIWTNPEYNLSTLKIFASVSQVPLPAAAWLLLGGIGGLVGVRRLRKTA